LAQREPVESVVVCGGGAAGMAAAIAAARAGADVTLIEAAPRLGGTVAHALIHTLGGLFDSRGELLNGGLAAELAERLTEADTHTRRRRLGRAWVLGVCPQSYQSVTERWIADTAGIRVLLSTRVVEAMADGRRIAGLCASGPAGMVQLKTRAVIDTTGTAAVVRLISPTLLQDDGRGAAGGLIFTLRGVVPGTLAAPRGIAVVRALRRAAEESGLPAHCGKAWLDSGVHDDEVYVKLFVPLPEGWQDDRRIVAMAQRDQAAVVAFLQQLPGFADAEVDRTGSLGVRDGGRIRGEYCLTGADVRAGRKFADAACRAAWPIEYWDPEHGVSLEYVPDGDYYEVPLRSLRVQGLLNLWAAGKCLSADPLAHASARVVGTCWAMGEAAGKAAVTS
jgi:FAD dependent oxidoreductase